MRTRAPDGDEEPLWYVPCVVRLPPYPHPPPPPPPPTLRRHDQHPLPPHPSAYFGSVHHFSPYHQRDYHFMPPAIAVTRRRTSIVGDGQLRRLATPPPATQRRPHRLLPVDARFHIRRPSLRNSPWTQHSLDGGTVRSRTYEPTCTNSCCRHRKSSKGRSESGGSLPTSPNGDQYTHTPPDSPIFVFRRADSSSLDITAHSSSTASLQSAVDYDLDNVPNNEEHSAEGAAEDKAEDESRCDGSHATPYGIYRRNAESQHPQSRCCSVASAASGSSSAKVRRRRSHGHICPHHKGRPWSLEVSTLSEGDEEGDETVDAAGAPADPSTTQQGRSRSLTHIDTLDPTVLVKAAAAAADSKEGLSLEGLRHLSGSAEFPSQARLDVPGGGLQDTKLRRHKLTRSQVSSSEYFSVSFECLDDPGPEEFIPAAKGTSLADALSGVCSRRGIDLNSVNVFQDSIKRPLPIHSTETSRLGGKHLKIKAKDEKSPNRSVKGSISQGPSRKTSGNYKSKGNKFFSASTEDTSFASDCPSHEGSLKGPSKASKQRWSNLFGNNKDNLRMGTLAETLDNYSKNGIPKLPTNWIKKSTENLESEVDAAEANGTNEDEEEILLLEDDWREVIGGDACATQMTEREMQQQTAIWELLTTEAAYIKTLKVVTDLFLACLLSLQTSSGILTEVDTEHLFSNIREIHSANFYFWKHHLLPMVADSRRRSSTKTSGYASPALLDPKLMKDGFLKFGEIFHPYTKYCGDQSRCQQYCREKIHENEIFTAYLAWCETRKECNRLRLQDIVVKPMQRLTKYSLLLKAIQRHTENANDVESLDQMIKAVDEFVNGVNTTLKQRQDQERLRGIIARIESYDVVETKDDEIEKLVKTYSELDLTCPMPGCNPSQRRHLLLEADLRLRDHSTSKTEVHIFLFTDMLLICKPVTKKSGGGGGGGNTGGVGGPSGGIVGVVSHGGSSSGTGSSAPERLLKVIRQPFVVDQLVVKEASSANALSLVYLNEFKVATAALTLSASEPKVIKSLNEAIQKAQDQYRKLKKKARLEEADEAVAAAMAANAAAATPSPHAPKLAALSPYDSANSSCCLCYYDDGGASTAASVGMGDASSVMGLIPSCPRSPRCSSSRGSRLSSLAHSHSGSMEMNEASSGGGSACQSRGISVETMTDLRGSSLSSDEGSNSATAGAMSDSSAGGHLTQQLPSPAPPSTSTSTPSLHQIPLVPPTSPRPERRAVLSRSPTPNTLSVMVPYTSSQANTATSPSSSTPNMRTCLGGQSLPNLSSVGGGRASGSTQHHHHPSPSSMFLVPPSRSPPPPPIGVNQRGISYPPPSPPRSLRRAYAVVAPQSFRNPPLTKTRHVGSVGTPSFSIGINADTASQGISCEEGGDGGSLPISLDIDVPVIRSVQTPSVGGNPSLQSQEREDSGVGCGDGAEGSSQNPDRQEMPENPRKTPVDTPASYEMPSRQGLVKRLGRAGERQDNRRYHTAGAIDDIKKQDGRDTVIHKRLSWNCGSNDQPTNVSQETHQLDNPPPFLVSSFESVQSSSGVSSARSSNVHLPADEEESSADDRWANPGMFSPSTIGGAFLKVLTPEFFRDITSSQKCPSPSRSKAIEHDPWVDDASEEILPPVEAVNEQVVHMASGGEGSSEMGTEETAQGGASSRPSKADLLRMKDFILTDSSIEASDV